MKQILRRLVLVLLAAAVAAPAWPAADDAGTAAKKPEASAPGPITADMVRQVGGPPKPDNGKVDVAPGMPEGACAKAVKERKLGKADKEDRSGKKERPHKGECSH